MSAMDALVACRAAWDRQHWQQSFALETLSEGGVAGQPSWLADSANTGRNTDEGLVSLASRSLHVPLSLSVSDLPVSVGPCPAVVPDGGVSPGMGRNAETGSNLAGSPEHHPCHDASTVPRGGSHDALPASLTRNQTGLGGSPVRASASEAMEVKV